METDDLLHRSIEKAVAFAHAAADEPTSYRIWEARTYSAEALSCFERLEAGVARRSARTLRRVRYLRALLAGLDRHDTRPPRLLAS
jgi:hypothetical protein